MKRNKLEEAFEECLSQLLAGAPVEDCLRRHPEHASELRPLLETAQLLASTQLPQPSPEFQLRARAHFRERLIARRHSKFIPSPLFSPFRLSMIAAAAAVSIAVLALTSAAFLSDRGSGGENPPLPVQVRKSSLDEVLGKAERTVAQMQLALQDGQTIDPEVIEELAEVNSKLARIVNSGGLDEPTKQVVQNIAGKQVIVLSQIATVNLVPAKNTSQIEAALVTSTNILKALGIPPETTALPEPTVTPSATASPEPTLTPTPTAEPSPTVEPTPAPSPTATENPPTVEPTQTSTSSSSSAALPTPTPTGTSPSP